MRRIYFLPTCLLLILTLIVSNTHAQSLAVNTDGSQADASAILDIRSVTKGTLLTRMTEAERNAISLPATGLLIYQTDVVSGYYYNSGTTALPVWQKMSLDKTTVAFSSNYVSGVNQPFIASTYVKVQFNTEEYDEANNFIPGATSEFTAPSAGIYHFDAVVTFTGTSTRYDVAFFVNGIQKKNTLWHMTSGLLSIPVNGDLKLNAGDKVDVRIYGSGAPGVILAGSGPWINFSGHKVN